MVPTIAALVLAGLRMQSAAATSASYTRQESLARILPQVDALINSLQAERDTTVGQLSAGAPTRLSGLAGIRSSTDADVVALRRRLLGVDTSRDKSLRGKLSGAIDGLSGLGELRRTATWAGVAPTSVATEYTGLVHGLLGLPGLLAARSSNGEVARLATGLSSLDATMEAVSQQRLIIYSALRANGLRGTALTDLVAANAAQRVGEVDYLAVAPAAGQALYRATVRGASLDTMTDAMDQVLGTLSIQGLGVTAPHWLAAASEVMSKIAQVQAGERASLVSQLHALAQSARRDALISAGLIYAVLGFALLATLLVARSILRPLNMLRLSALDVAYRSLPDTVRRLDDNDSSDGVVDVAAIGVDRKDEIGQVARAFDAVHGEAARLAAHQAVMRDNVSKMFINLSQRSQILVEQQLRLIDELEAGEPDADQLANLFRLDHLATRMRRNDENLLVLAGADTGRRRTDPVPVLDVLRAASAEVEQYSRVKLDAQPGFELAADAARDVKHLLAELIENATGFSPVNVPVWVRSRSLDDAGELMIEVEDHGIGIAAAELAAANEQLISPPTLEAAVSQQMGLFVVGRLARRHGIVVMLLASPSGGLTAYVRLPAALVAASAPNHVAPVPAASQQPAPIFEELQSTWFRPRPDARTSAGLPVRVPGRNLVGGNGTPAEPAGGPATKTATHLDASESHALSSHQQGIHRARIAGQGAIRHREPATSDTDEGEHQR